MKDYVIKLTDIQAKELELAASYGKRSPEELILESFLSDLEKFVFFDEVLNQTERFFGAKNESHSQVNAECSSKTC